MKMQEEFSPVVPVSLYAAKPEFLVKDLQRMHDEFGFSRFILVAPGVRRRVNRADLAFYGDIGRKISEIRNALKRPDIKIGWWCCPTFQAAPEEPWQRIMDCDGNLSDSICPLDENHAADYAAKLCEGLRNGKPDPIFIEDDVTLSNHGGLNTMRGCFCPLHMKAFAIKTGRAFTPYEVADMFRNPTAANEPLRKAWADMARESLVWFASYVRREIDKVSPDTRVCQCQSGFVDFDGDTTEAVARAWAGKTRPLVRLFGAGYFNQNLPPDIPDTLSHLLWSAQHLPDDFEMLHETDAYPHTRFFNSSLFLISEFAGALMAGVHDSYYYCLQYTDEPLCDPGYAARMRDFRNRFSVVRDFRLGAKPVGVRMVYSPRECYMLRGTKKSPAVGMLSVSTHFLTKLGFPVVTREEDAPMATLFGNTPEVLTDDEIRQLLKGGLFIDGEAAEILSRRGFSQLIGVEATDDKDCELEFTTEQILEPAQSSFRGRGVYYSRFKSKPTLGWTPSHFVFADLRKRAPSAVVWSAFFDIDKKMVAPSVIYFENSIGGRIGIMARSVDTSAHVSLFCPHKQELFHHLFAKLSGERIQVRAPKTPGTFLLAAEKEGELMVMVNNLAGEPRNDVKLEFATGWNGKKAERLLPDGTWCHLPPDYTFEPMVPEFLKVPSSCQ